MILDDTNSFLLEIRCPGEYGVPLSLAGWLLTTIGEACPNTVMADSPQGAPICVRIAKADVDTLVIEEEP